MTAVLVPFDRWNGARFDGYVGERWNRFFITIDEGLRTAARARIGSPVTMVVSPTSSRKAYLAALAQSAVTTQPGKPRADAVAFPGTEDRRPARTARSRTGRRSTRRR